MMELINLTGQRFGRLIVLQYDHDKARWLCRCDCGRETYVTRRSLRRGCTRSCGCLRHEARQKLGRNRRRPVRCVETGVTYESQTAAAESTGIHQSAISQCLHGKLSHTGGLTWEEV